jgi:large subunit ribosomal protein L23
MRARPKPKRYLRKLAARRQLPLVHRVGPELRPHQVILRPIVTEKSTHQSTRSERYPSTDEDKAGASSAYTFQVCSHATKTQVKAAVEEMFSVRVEKVRTQMVHGKKRRYRNRFGQLPDWKKAVVTLHPEDRIEFF